MPEEPPNAFKAAEAVVAPVPPCAIGRVPKVNAPLVVVVYKAPFAVALYDTVEVDAVPVAYKIAFAPGALSVGT